MSGTSERDALSGRGRGRGTDHEAARGGGPAGEALTCRAVLAGAEKELAEAGIPAARLEAEVLLARRLGVERTALILEPGRIVAAEPLEAFRVDLARRASRYPLQYITGVQEFYALLFEVDERVLIPRPETEMIVDEVIRLAKEKPRVDEPTGDSAAGPSVEGRPGVDAKPHDDTPRAGEIPGVMAGADVMPRKRSGPRADAMDQPPGANARQPMAIQREDQTVRGAGGPVIVDVGTGSGCIAVALAVALGARGSTARGASSSGQGCTILATDISPDALEVAARNASRHHVEGWIRFRCGDGLAPALDEGLAGQADFVVSNPPYIAAKELEGLQAELRHEPRIALSPGEDGLEITRGLVRDAARVVRRGGWLLVELSMGRALEARGLLAPALWEAIDVKADMQGIPRLLVARRR